MYICYIYIYAATWVDLRKASLMLDIVFALVNDMSFLVAYTLLEPF